MKNYLSLITILLSISISSRARVLSTCTSSLPTVTGISTVCGSGSASVTVSGEAIQYWYTTSIGGLGTSVTGSVFLTPVLTTNTNFWITSYDGSCESDRVGITAHVLSKPLQPTVTGMSTVCGSGSIQIKVNSEFENIWYSSSVGGIALDTTGAVFNTSLINDSTTYWVSGYNGNKGCESERVKVIARVFDKPQLGTIVLDSLWYYDGPYNNYNKIETYRAYYKVKVTTNDYTKTVAKFVSGGYNSSLLYPHSYKNNTDSLKFQMIWKPYRDSLDPSGFYTIAFIPGTITTANIKMYLLNTKNSCRSDTAYHSAPLPQAPTNIRFDFKNEDYVIYPNPNNGTFKINPDENVISVEAINSLGQKETFRPPFQQITTSFNGLVLLNIQTRNGQIVKKIIIE